MNPLKRGTLRTCGGINIVELFFEKLEPESFLRAGNRTRQTFILQAIHSSLDTSLVVATVQLIVHAGALLHTGGW